MSALQLRRVVNGHLSSRKPADLGTVDMRPAGTTEQDAATVTALVLARAADAATVLAALGLAVAS